MSETLYIWILDFGISGDEGRQLADMASKGQTVMPDTYVVL